MKGRGAQPSSLVLAYRQAEVDRTRMKTTTSGDACDLAEPAEDCASGKPCSVSDESSELGGRLQLAAFVYAELE